MTFLTASWRQDRPGGVGARDLHEDGGAEESGDSVGAEGLHRGRDMLDAGRGGHLQGQSEQHFSTSLSNLIYLQAKIDSKCSFLLSCPDPDPGRDRGGAGAGPAAHQEQVQSAV